MIKRKVGDESTYTSWKTSITYEMQDEEASIGHVRTSNGNHFILLFK